ncbi:aldose 1-epimerase family protein [Porifericola rhodea]|uniref:aldose 1-epimerase family protein n=1 Tax=Porifericola rhodea TaxID=930972 RepID=UPI0026653EEC|nr:aldose 1-epimerase family protein [Porifericola rhodea]WKN32453.1 aldose 1-epimerase family protein [Porifericola rhodea]
MDNQLQYKNWQGKVSNHTQLGGIETSVLDNGLGRGSRIAWINTGTGLRYKVVLDRAMDIVDAFYNQHSLSWISYGGITPPQPTQLRGLDWLKVFGGGLLTSCGLTHIGGPEEDVYGARGLHDQVSNTPAQIESIVQPDPFSGKLEMSISGSMKLSQVFGPHLELKRTISGTLGSASIHIQDEVINRGNSIAPHMMLYHVNLGWPLVDEGAEIFWKGKWQARESDNTVIFSEDNNFRKCPPPLESHSRGGEEAAFIDVEADDKGICTCGVYNRQLELALSLSYQKSQLPWLTNWQHWGKGEYVSGLEPGTHPPIGQAEAREMDTLIHLEPGDSRTYALTFEVREGKELVEKFLDDNNLR